VKVGADEREADEIGKLYKLKLDTTRRCLFEVIEQPGTRTTVAAMDNDESGRRELVIR
jgi:hypothetical protein